MLPSPAKSSWIPTAFREYAQREANTNETLLRLLQAGDPIAKIVESIPETFVKPPYIGVLGAVIQKHEMLSLLPTVWLSDEIITAVLGLHMASRPDIQLIGLTVLAFHLSSPSEHKPDYPPINVPEGVDTIIIPTNINQLHWILAVVRLDSTQRSGAIAWYNSAGSFQSASRTICKDLPGLLNLSGTYPGSQIRDHTWTIESGDCYQQTNGSDCGIHTIRYGVAVVQDEDIATLKFNSAAL